MDCRRFAHGLSVGAREVSVGRPPGVDRSPLGVRRSLVGYTWVSRAVYVGFPWDEHSAPMVYRWVARQIYVGTHGSPLVGHGWFVGCPQVARGVSVCHPRGVRGSPMRFPSVSWVVCGSPMDCPRVTRAMSEGRSGVVRGSPVGYTWVPHGSLKGCAWVAMGCPWAARGMSMGRPWDIRGVHVGRPKVVCGLSAGCPWGARGPPMGCP